MNELQEFIDICVDQTIKYLHSAGFSDANKTNIWTKSIYNYQLNCKLKNFLPVGAVEEIITYNHNKVVKSKPELKECSLEFMLNPSVSPGFTKGKWLSRY